VALPCENNSRTTHTTVFLFSCFGQPRFPGASGRWKRTQRCTYVRIIQGKTHGSVLERDRRARSALSSRLVLLRIGSAARLRKMPYHVFSACHETTSHFVCCFASLEGHFPLHSSLLPSSFAHALTLSTRSYLSLSLFHREALVSLARNPRQCQRW
jgi:hypothetical protein